MHTNSTCTIDEVIKEQDTTQESRWSIPCEGKMRDEKNKHSLIHKHYQDTLIKCEDHLRETS